MVPFLYDLLPRVELKAHLTEEGRIYETPVGPLRSVTTILKEKLSDKKLQEWRERVGPDEAERISTQARLRGSRLHSACEHYLKGINVIDDLMPSNQEMFMRVIPILDKNITKIYGIEIPLYSGSLKTAGRADALLAWQHHNCILDFKTSRYPLDKRDERIAKYNLQETVYAMMTEEMYDICFPYNVLVILPGSSDEPQVIIKTNFKYRALVKRLFQ